MKVGRSCGLRTKPTLNCWLEKRPVLDRSSQIDRHPEISAPPTNYSIPTARKVARLQYVNPQETLHDPAAYADSTYNYFETSSRASKLGVEDKRKKKTNNVRPGQSVSLGSVGEYIDEEDIGDASKLVAEQQPTKRLKPAPTKLNKIKKAPFKIQASETDDDGLLNSPSDQYDKLQHRPQLTTPPDTGKRAQNRAPSVKEKGKTGLPAFKNLTITKTTHVQAKDSQSTSNSSMDAAPVVVSYQGWSSTESAVKNNVITKGQTTLDKLAAFRYKAPSSSPHVRHHTPTCEKTSHALQVNDAYNDDNHLPAIPEVDHIPRCDEFFHEANWSINTHDQVGGNSTNLESMFECEALQDTSQLNVLENEVGTDLCFNGNNRTADSAPHRSGYVEAPGLSTAKSSSTHNPFSTFDSSSHGRVLNSLLSVVDMAREDDETMYDASLRLEMPPVVIRQLEMMSGNNDYTSHQETTIPVESCAEILNLPPQVQPNSQHLTNQVPSRIVVECIKDAPGESDGEYDEGIHDIDLIAVSYDSEMRTSSRDREHKDSAVPNNSVSSHGSKMPQPPKSVGEYTDIAKMLPSSPAVLESDPDMDLLLMELAEEEEQKGTFRMTGDAVETFEAPSSIQHSLPCDTSDKEVYDSTLQYSPPSQDSPVEQAAHTSYGAYDANNHRTLEASPPTPVCVAPQASSEDWCFMKPLNSSRSQAHESPLTTRRHVPPPQKGLVELLDEPGKHTQSNADTVIRDDLQVYAPLDRCSRPEFPNLVRDHSPIVGASARSFLRVCFRIHEMYREGARCFESGRDGVIELFARVTFSSRNPGTTKQHFQFADLWSKHPPFATGILENLRPQSLADVEGQGLIGGDVGKMVRCLGRLRREKQNSSGWLLHIINIRQTDWEEIRWTKRIVSADAMGA
jgi:hypothetical protein